MGSEAPPTNPAPSPPFVVDTPAPVRDVEWTPPKAETTGDNLDGLTRGCFPPITKESPAQLRTLPGRVALPQVRFVALAGLDSPRDAEPGPTRESPYYSFAAPLIVLPGPRGRVTLAISATNAKVGFVYRSTDLTALYKRYRLPADAARVTFPVCSYDGRPTAVSWFGYVATDRPTRARLDLFDAGGHVEASKQVHLGVPTC